MTRVDVSNVAIVTRADGAPIFLADQVSYIVDKNHTLWLSFKDENGEVFAIARVAEERANNFLVQAAVDLGGRVLEGVN